MTKEQINTFSYRISQASRTDLIVILFDMSKQYLEDGITAYEAKDKEGFINALKNAKRVIDEISRSLDMQYPISGELKSIYMYIGKTLNSAMLKSEITELSVVLNVIAKLRQTFKELAQTDDSGPLMANTQKVYAGLTYSNGRLNELAYDANMNRGITV